MKSKAQPVTLKSIGKLIDQKLGQRFDPVYAELKGLNTKFSSLDSKVSGVETKIVGIYGELDGLKQQIIGVDVKVDDLKKDMNKGFDQVYSTIQEGLGDLNEETDKKIKTISLLQRV